MIPCPYSTVRHPTACSSSRCPFRNVISQTLPRGDNRLRRHKMAGNYRTKRHLELINSQSVNQSSANKSINMLTLTMIQTLDLFRVLNLGTGARECVIAPRKTGWITIWILLAGSEIKQGAGEKYPWKFRKCPWNWKKKEEEEYPPRWRCNRSPLLCFTLFRCIHWAVKYSREGVSWVVCGDL